MSKKHHNTTEELHKTLPEGRQPTLKRGRKYNAVICLFILVCTAIVFLNLFSAKIRLILSIVVCSIIAILVLYDILDDTVFDSIRHQKIEKMIEDERQREDEVN